MRFTCVGCGQVFDGEPKVLIGRRYCDACFSAELGTKPPAQISQRPATGEAPPPEPASVQSTPQAPPSPSMPTGQVACLLLGLALAGVSLYYLLVQPGNPGSQVLGEPVVNLHRLAVGQTAGVAAAVFMAAAFRPLGHR